MAAHYSSITLDRYKDRARVMRLARSLVRLGRAPRSICRPAARLSRPYANFRRGRLMQHAGARNQDAALLDRPTDGPAFGMEARTRRDASRWCPKQTEIMNGMGRARVSYLKWVGGSLPPAGAAQGWAAHPPVPVRLTT